MMHVIDYIKQHKRLLWVIIPAFFFHMLVIMPSGSYYCFAEKCGLYFWGAHDHDAIWHFAIIETAFKQIPFLLPTFAGANLTGYNILLDIIIFAFAKIGISPLFTYFKILPLVWFFFFTATAVILARKIHNSPLFVGLVLFFLFFGNSFSFLLRLYHFGTISGAAGSLAMQSGKILTNLQLSFSFIFILGLLFILKKNTFSWKHTLLISLFLFLNIGLKFYGGAVSMVLAGLYLLNFLITEKNVLKTFQHALVIGLVTIISVILFYDPFSSLSSGSIFIFSPFAASHAMIEEKDLFYLPDMVNARYFLEEAGGFSPRLLYIELVAAFLYLFFNFGVRFFGLLYFLFRAVRKKTNRFEVFIFITIGISTAISLLFIQKGEWWNTVQFFYYALFLANIFTALFVFDLLKKKHILSTTFAVIMIILTIIPNVDVVQAFSGWNVSHIQKAELDALAFLKKQPHGIIFDSFPKNVQKQYSLYDYNNTSHVSAFTGKQTYLSDFVQLRLLGVDYKQREKMVNELNCNIFSEVDYIYYIKAHKKDIIDQCSEKVEQRFKKAFENDLVLILDKKNP